jgi:hypothetical protein
MKTLARLCMTSVQVTVVGLTAVLSWSIAAPVVAQPKVVEAAAPVAAGALTKEVAPEELRKRALEAKDAARQGWTGKVNLGGSGSLGNSSGVVGTADGTTMQIGGMIDSTAEWVGGQHEWLSALKIVHVQSRDTVLKEFIKSSDALDLSTTYTYHLPDIAWLGPYARGRLATQLFPGYVVQPAAFKARFLNSKGLPTTTPDRDVAAKARLDLTTWFEPLILSESAGAFAHPTNSKYLTLKTKLGVGAQHVLMQDGYAVGDDKATPELELKQLQGAHQAGSELDLAAQGELTQLVNWRAGGNFFLPVYSSEGSDDTGLGRTSINLLAGLSIKLAKWASLDYTFVARKIPLVIDEWQIQHGFLLTTGFQMGFVPDPPPPPPADPAPADLPAEVTPAA